MDKPTAKLASRRHSETLLNGSQRLGMEEEMRLLWQRHGHKKAFRFAFSDYGAMALASTPTTMVCNLSMTVVEKLRYLVRVDVHFLKRDDCSLGSFKF